MSFTRVCNKKTVEESDGLSISMFCFDYLETNKPEVYSDGISFTINEIRNKITVSRENLDHIVPIVRHHLPKRGYKHYWRCPQCGRLCCQLYWADSCDELRCRRCANLIYQCQKERTYTSPKWLDC